MTGLPTLEAEPVRKRSAGFRHTPVSSPGGSRSQSPSPTVSPNTAEAVTVATPKRSFSTIIPSRSISSPGYVGKYHRERQSSGNILPAGGAPGGGEGNNNVPDIV